MNSTNKTKTSLAKFEEFFNTNYKDDVLEVLKNYPKRRSLVIDFNDLEMFDSDLADLLIEKPEEVISASQKAIKNINPFMQDAELNIRFKNVANEVPLKHLLSRYIGNFVSTKGLINKVSEFRPRMEIAVFECRSCMRIQKVEQNSNHLMEPSLCSDCGGRSFRLLQEESKYIDTQSAIITDFKEELTEREDLTELPLVFEDDLIKKLRVGDYVNITGILKTFQNENTRKFVIYLYVNYIEYLDLDSKLDSDFYEDEDYEVDDRRTVEYNEWRRQVLARDNFTCQCCGDSKYPIAHHIFNFKHYEDLRTDVDNGITLCKWCHGKYHSHYGQKANPVTLMEFMKRFGGVILKTPHKPKKDKPPINYGENTLIEPEYSSDNSSREKIRCVYYSIKEFENTNNLPVPFETIKEECDNVDDDTLKNILKELKSRGLIYEFKSRSYMTASH